MVVAGHSPQYDWAIMSFSSSVAMIHYTRNRLLMIQIDSFEWMNKTKEIQYFSYAHILGVCIHMHGIKSQNNLIVCGLVTFVIINEDRENRTSDLRVWQSGNNENSYARMPRGPLGRLCMDLGVSHDHSLRTLLVAPITEPNMCSPVADSKYPSWVRVRNSYCFLLCLTSK